MTRATRRQKIVKMIEDQLAWIEQCGGSLIGYVMKYGDPGIHPLDVDGHPKTVVLDDADLAARVGLAPVPHTDNAYYMPYSGNGGTAIYNADLNELRRLESLL